MTDVNRGGRVTGKFVIALLGIVLIAGCSKKGTESELTVPSLDYPDNGQTFEVGENIWFMWFNDESAMQYHLQVADDEEFDSLFVEIICDEDDASRTTYQPSPPLDFAPTIWYWRVRSGDESSWSDWSTSWLFTVTDTL
jgi:hypothetical protein